MADLADIAARLDRLLAAVERLAPPPGSLPDFSAAEAFLWDAEHRTLRPVAKVNRVDLSLLKGIDGVRDILLATPGVSPAGSPPTTHSCGARAAWERARW
jgi:hypothetical protein